jgi:hypothetical protein
MAKKVFLKLTWDMSRRIVSIQEFPTLQNESKHQRPQCDCLMDDIKIWIEQT